MYRLLMPVAVLALSISFAVVAGAADAPAGKTLFHVVSVKFKEGSTPAQIAEIEKAFAALKDKIPGVVSLNWGTNVSPEKRNKGFTHCFVLTFASEADRDTYLAHADHQAFVKIIVPVADDVMVIDFWSHSAAAPANTTAGTLFHVVSLKLKEGATKEQIEAAETAFAALKEKVPNVIQLDWGTDVSPEHKNKGYSHCFVLRFPADADRDNYLVHPDHKALGKVLGPVRAEVTVIDFHAK